MKKICFFLLVFFLFLFPHKIRAEEIRSFDSHIQVNKDGAINVRETIMYDFGSVDRHGIYRIIPTIKTNKEEKKFRMDFTNFSVTDQNATPYRYTVVNENDKLKIKIGDPDKTISGLHTYVISYKVSGALTYFSDHDELYWNVTGNEWNVPIQKSISELSLPAKIGRNEIHTLCYIGTTGSKEIECIRTDYDRSKVVVESSRGLQPSEGFTVVIGFPKNIVSVLEPKEVIPFFETLLGKIVAMVLFLLATFWYVIYPFKIIYQWYKYGRDPKRMTGETRAWFDPPRLKADRPLGEKGNRFLTPGEVGTLGDETADLKDISATIIDLARRGFLRIEERKKGDFYFARRSLDEGGLLPFEKRLLQGLFESGKTIRLKDEELYETVEDVKKKLYEKVVEEGLFPKNPQSIRTFYSAIGGIALGTLNFFLAAVAFIFGRNMPKKTVEGVSAFNVAKSLKNFLTSQERQLAFQADKQMMFEKLLPYAVAFGVEKIWAKRFETMNLKQPDWYQGYGQTQFNSIILANSMSSSFSSFRMAATPARSSSGFSSGFSGRSSGGGSGGGGGGSW